MKRRPVWKVLLAGGAVAVLIPLLWVWKLFLDANAILEGRSGIDLLERDLETRDPERPGLFGDGVPGDAWDAYTKAAEAFRRVMDKAGYYDVADPSEPGVEFLRRGAQAQAVSFRSDRLLLEKGRAASDLRDLLGVVNDLASRHHVKGRDGDALERVRLVLAVVRDLELHGRHPRELADVEMDAHEVSVFVLEKHALEPAELRAHAAFLDRLEELRPSLLPAIRFALDPALLRKEPGWRHLYSDTLCQAALVRETDAVFAVAESLVVPVEDRLRAIGRFPPSQVLWQVDEIFMIDGARRAYARLARLGVELAARERELGRFPESLPASLLRCPYSGLPLVYRPAEGMVYSPGFDLRDDGGTPVDPGQWTHWPQLRYKAKGDLVVRVRRKE
jgi:hypothetical protein